MQWRKPSEQGRDHSLTVTPCGSPDLHRFLGLATNPTHYKSPRAKRKPAKLILFHTVQTLCGLQTLPFRNLASLVIAGFTLTIPVREMS